MLRLNCSEAKPPEFKFSLAPFSPFLSQQQVSPCPVLPRPHWSHRWAVGDLQRRALSAQPPREFLPDQRFFPPIFFPGACSPWLAKLWLTNMPVTRRDKRRQGGILLEADGKLLSPAAESGSN